MRVRVLFLSVLLLIPLGCGQLQDYLEIVQDRGLSPRYLSVLKNYTRSETIYSQFETMFSITATLRSSRFDRAYKEEYTRIYSIPVQKTDRFFPGQISASKEFIDFYFYAYLPDREDNDFARPRSIWRVFLLDEKGNRFDHVKLRQIDKITPVIESFFPYVNRHYGKFYLVRFPITAGNKTPLKADAKGLNLVFTSVLGRATLKWN